MAITWETINKQGNMAIRKQFKIDYELYDITKIIGNPAMVKPPLRVRINHSAFLVEKMLQVAGSLFGKVDRQSVNNKLTICTLKIK